MTSASFEGRCRIRLHVSIDRAIDVDAAGRYGSVGDLVDDLHDALGGDTSITGFDARAGDVRRQSLQRVTSVRRCRCSRFLRSRTSRRTADRAPRSQRHPRAVRRRGRSERQWQVERREGRAASCDPARGGAAVRFVVHDRDDPGKPSVRAARGRAARASPSIPPSSLLEQLAGEQGLQRAVNRVLPHDGSQLLLLIDQFEELFTQVDPATANRFLANLVSAVTDEQSRIRVVATLARRLLRPAIAAPRAR